MPGRNKKRSPKKRKEAVRIVDGINSVDGINQYVHSNNKRPYNPPVGLVTSETDKETPKTKYVYDPYLDPSLSFDGRQVRDEISAVIGRGLSATTIDEAKTALEALRRAQEPYLNWSGKAEHTSFAVDTVSLHVHERIDP
jgi:adenine-specific DNA-methyltransferase